MSRTRTDQAIVRPITSEYFLGQQPHEIFKNNSHIKRTTQQNAFFGVRVGWANKKKFPKIQLHLSLRICYSGPSLPRNSEHLWLVNPRYTYT